MSSPLQKRSKRLLPSLFPLEDMVSEAITFIRDNEPPEGYFVGFSGGKYSIVTLELCRMAGVKHHSFYSCTGIDAPEMVRFIRQHYSDVTFLYPKLSFWEGIRKKSPPLRTRRWCYGETMTFLDLCAGIGGFSLGLELAGMTCKGKVEAVSALAAMPTT